MNKKLSNRRPALDNHENFCLRLLYGCGFNVKFFRFAIVAISGQIAVDGVPIGANIRVNKIWFQSKLQNKANKMKIRNFSKMTLKRKNRIFFKFKCLTE